MARLCDGGVPNGSKAKEPAEHDWNDGRVRLVGT
jgi:hypothetical protein